MNAASSGVAVIFEPMIVAAPFALAAPATSFAYASAAFAGPSSTPETADAIVSRMWNFACSTAASGSARCAASAMYVLSVVIIALGGGAAVTILGTARAAADQPAAWSTRRRAGLSIRFDVIGGLLFVMR